MDGTPLVLGLEKHFVHGFQHTKTLVANNEFHPIQATAMQLLEATNPASLILFHTLCSTQNLTISILINCNSDQNGYIFKLFAPVVAQIDPIHIDIWISPTLLRTVPPIIDGDIRFLIQLTNGEGRGFAAPQRFCNGIHTLDRYACQVHLNKSFLHAALPAAVPLNDGGLKGDSP